MTLPIRFNGGGCQLVLAACPTSLSTVASGMMASSML